MNMRMLSWLLVVLGGLSTPVVAGDNLVDFVARGIVTDADADIREILNVRRGDAVLVEITFPVDLPDNNPNPNVGEYGGFDPQGASYQVTLRTSSGLVITTNGTLHDTTLTVENGVACGTGDGYRIGRDGGWGSFRLITRTSILLIDPTGDMFDDDSANGPQWTTLPPDLVANGSGTIEILPDDLNPTLTGDFRFVVLDFCQADPLADDCNADGIPDDCGMDCNMNGVADVCDIANGDAFDCNGNDIPDACEILDGWSTDHNGNGIPDGCDADCNENGFPDDFDIAKGNSADCDGNGVPDECEDCNSNGVGDACDISQGVSLDCNADGLPDECGVDCNANGIDDTCDIDNGTSLDADRNGVPDECEQSILLNGTMSQGFAVWERGGYGAFPIVVDEAFDVLGAGHGTRALKSRPGNSFTAWPQDWMAVLQQVDLTVGQTYVVEADYAAVNPFEEATLIELGLAVADPAPYIVYLGSELSVVHFSVGAGQIVRGHLRDIYVHTDAANDWVGLAMRFGDFLDPDPPDSPDSTSITCG